MLSGRAGSVTKFLDGTFQAGKIEIKSFGEKSLIFGVKRADGRVFGTPKQATASPISSQHLKAAKREVEPIVKLTPDGHSSYPQVTGWLGMVHHPVNWCEASFVDERGFYTNGIENLWRYARDWIKTTRGYESRKTLKRAIKKHQV
ncbi:hypothetical protein AKJ57_00945 [candidate division MSBL1 archaeon SCGC-AAA259A05]|uniref:ISXO2-like transposase domain-containing protein n=1 Tax=candidate division MSBL1 archaeon SCGC-AAA259A05 TaxID=1698259 RepID=A0A133UBB8_9EURY|nr:hypothetical protein AKJ57_00945 [candidate division MSBL1 archaeon SCGC-AAA259A05]